MIPFFLYPYKQDPSEFKVSLGTKQLPDLKQQKKTKNPWGPEGTIMTWRLPRAGPWGLISQSSLSLQQSLNTIQSPFPGSGSQGLAYLGAFAAGNGFFLSTCHSLQWGVAVCPMTSVLWGIWEELLSFHFFSLFLVVWMGGMTLKLLPRWATIWSFLRTL